MSRAAIPLHHPSLRPALSDHVEVFISQGGFSDAFSSDVQLEPQQFLTVIVNLDVGSHQLTPLFTEVSGKTRGVLEHYYLFPRDGKGVGLSGQLDGFDVSTLNIVVQLPDAGLIDNYEVDGVVSCFVHSKHLLNLVVGVARCPDDWQSLIHLTHFAASPGSTVQRDAVALFKSLCTFMAPSALVETDEWELRQSLGTALSPTRIAHAVWLQDEKKIKFLSERDLILVTDSTDIFVALFRLRPDITVAGQLYDQVREFRQSDAPLRISLTYDFFEEDHRLPHNCSSISIFCRKKAGVI